MRRVASALLSFLLFLSLFALGVTFMLNKTILSPDFATSSLGKIDISALVEELPISALGKEMPPETRDKLIDVIDSLESQIRLELSVAIGDIYDFLLSKTGGLDLALTLRNTLLSNDLAAAAIDELEISPFIEEAFTEELVKQVPLDRELLARYIGEAITEEWAKEQANIAAPQVIDYLLGQRQSLYVTISLKEPVNNLKDSLREDFVASPPISYSGLPPAELEQLFDTYFAQFAGMIPKTAFIDESFLDPNLPAQIAGNLAMAEDSLIEAREYVRYIQIAYTASIVLLILSIVGIALINRRLKDTMRCIGITFVAYGVLELGGAIALKCSSTARIVSTGMPAQLQVLIPQVTSDIMVLLQMFSLVVLIVGIAFIALTFIYKSPSSMIRANSLRR